MILIVSLPIGRIGRIRLAHSPAPTATKDLRDTDIRGAVLREYAIDGVVPIEQIDVAVTSGIVALTGRVPSILAKERAVRIAEGVRGVRAVSDRLAVAASKRADDEIREDVKKALLADPATDSYELDVAVKDQVVTLTGKVESRAELELAGTVAKGVKGAVGLQNRIELEYTGTRPDAEIAHDIERRLRWDTLVDDSLIDVEVSGGVVTLKGVVGSVSEKRRSSYDAWVAGVNDVKSDDLDVERWARDDDLRKGKYVAKSDEQITEALRFAAALDPRVKSFNIEVNVDSGAVTLKGMVDNLRAKNAAEQLARDTVGVAAVQNELRVEPKTDIEERALAAEIKDALFRNVITEGYEIAVEAKDGVVTLRGKVDSYAEKAEAGEVAAGIVGTMRVVNLVDVEYQSAVYTYDPYLAPLYPYVPSNADYTHRKPIRSDPEIKTGIESELEWSPFVNEDEVDVAVKDGIATLTGRVDTWREQEVAIENAFEGGAVAVNAKGLVVGLQ